MNKCINRFLISLICFLFLFSAKAIAQNRKEAEKYFKEAIEYSEKHQYEKSLSAFTKAVENDPEHGEIYYHMAYCYLNLGKKEEALSCIEKVESLGPYDNYQSKTGETDEKAKTEEFIWIVANTYKVMGEYEKAIERFKKAMKLNPEAFTPYFQLGVIYFYTGRYNEAIPKFRKAIEIDPNSGDSYFFLGVSQEKLGFYEETVKNLSKAEEVYKRNKKKAEAKIARDAKKRMSRLLK